MSKRTAVILIIGTGVLLTAGVMLYVYGKDAERKKAYNTQVPPDYALKIIQEAAAKK